MIEFQLKTGCEERGRPLVPPPARAAVLGAGRSGIAASRLLLDKGYTVYLSDLRQNSELEKQCRRLAEPGFSYTLGGHDRHLLGQSDFIVLSPGIDEQTSLLKEPDIEGILVYGEVELAYWFCRWPIIALTGTNGKTTTVTLIDHILTAAGFESQAAGNIGRALCSTLGYHKDDTVLVAEISSFQLHTVESFHPRLALLLNLSPDHLERYTGLEDYYRSKMRLFERMDLEDIAIFNADDPGLVSRAESVSHTQVAFFGKEESPRHLSFIRGDEIYARPGGRQAQPVIRIAEIRIPGPHNLENILAATAAAAALDADLEAVHQAIGSFTGLPHRLEKVGTIDGITYVNDSKATTVESVARALESFSAPIVLIMGGRHKGSTFSPLVPGIQGRVRHLIALGEAASTIAAELGAATGFSIADSFEQAVKKAHELARPGDVVLLSPGCSSFDMFPNYEERGDRFKQIVLKEFV